MAAGLAGVDLTDLDNFADGFPHEVFEQHRAEAPVFWHEPTEHTPGGEGFWSVATYAEVLNVLTDPTTYSSETGGSRQYGGTLIEDIPVAGVVLNMMDDPRHGRIRRLVSKGLTPQTVRRLEEELRRRAGVLLDAVPDGNPVDFLVAVAAELPMQMICMLLGAPEEDRYALFAAVEPGFDVRAGDARAGAWPKTDMFGYIKDLIAEKRGHPTHDMLSAVVHARLEDEDPPTLTDDELLLFFSLLFAAGSETTRNAISGGLAALIDNAEQLQALRAKPELMPTAIEEVLRWTTPSPSKRRTATRAVQLSSHLVESGDKVVIWEGSANRDEKVFDDSMSFDITREPNPHLGFGHGVHFCLGANLARLEIRVLYEELFARFNEIEAAGPIEWTRSNRHTGVRHQPLVLRR
ncbi:MAG TPA: cytochrome P450 [Acidimicrobiales bacterium]|nr:cytochrome P450 [Acidimicrobiales bacterium]